MEGESTDPGRPRLGVAFGGGTARGLAHIGALKVLEAEAAAPDALAGTSYGAIIAALYALGTPALELERLVREQNTGEIWLQGLDFGLHRGSLIHGRRLARWLDRKFFFGATFADLQIPLVVACTDLATGRLAVIDTGPISLAVQASCALPGIFAPVRSNGRVLIDGGFVQTVPFRALSLLGPDLMIGLHAGLDVDNSRLVRGVRHVNASRLGRRFQHLAARFQPVGPFGQMVRGFAVSLRSYSRPLRAPKGHLLVREDPPAQWWDFHKSPQAIHAGERAMRRALEHSPRFFDRLRGVEVT
ncbi:MAG TPA: patatin-like phospholipase family protein [Trueperaceae bacterium]|nr:patatin-like phospholipase family protein [Trueperaceae bacterium]